MLAYDARPTTEMVAPPLQALRAMVATFEKRGAEVAPTQTFVPDVVLKEAIEIVGSKDASDFEDALQDSIMRANDWGPAATQTTHPPLDHDHLARTFGKEGADRFFAATSKIAARTRAIETRGGFPTAPPMTDYLGPVYSQDIPPAYRSRMFDFLCGYMAHLTLVYAVDQGRPLAPYVREGIVKAIEMAGDASEYFEAYRDK